MELFWRKYIAARLLFLLIGIGNRVYNLHLYPTSDPSVYTSDLSHPASFTSAFIIWILILESIIQLYFFRMYHNLYTEKEYNRTIKKYLKFVTGRNILAMLYFYAFFILGHIIRYTGLWNVHPEILQFNVANACYLNFLRICQDKSLQARIGMWRI